jgi:hypothetical protein
MWRIASIFRVEGKIRKSASEETVKTGTSRLLIHGATSQKTAFFIVTGVKISNLTLPSCFASVPCTL